ncbi:BREX-1 system phosphatase PglZ type A [Actimicrobium sp. CCI2.3]|uniref:BREX-1 system phosphatase PglZ type A n=1 Tax=Actimicrobium sp. CCI2.3 TaxID=3048616 RepID=UPI002AB57963|nr:BREX-1 system phosphatase PglZ type A [Actimicrobium sp. CCI2.3]MDY7573085.1 BREX-1 system phosphatase PglZ type A [Actimicrobium sp. CCI2.3]MEB0020882.1 BREX-1 system phosphatase PglZ type A [Actimicrobium sp. CCI2.3]
MSQKRLFDSLTAMFSDQPVVFWHDIEAEFCGAVDGLQLDGVQLVHLDDTAALQVKLNIERTPDQRWLIYSAKPEPEPTKDWLLDVRMRSKSFRADSTSILLEDLGLTTLGLRQHLKDRTKFLRAKDRSDRLKRLVLPSDGATDLDRKMMAVLARADQPDLFSILQRLYGAMVVDGLGDLTAQPKAWQEFAANDLTPAFWDLVQVQFGYADANPSLRDLLLRILVTDFCRGLQGDTPRQLAHFVLPDRSLAANASVFVARWRSDIAQFASYNALAQAVANELELVSLLSGHSAEQLVECMTFEDVELRVVQDLKQRIVVGAGANMDVVRALMARRRDGHWANPLLASANERTRALAACYDALTAAADFFSLKATHAAGFSFADAGTAFAQYRDELYRFDQLYRHFHTAADAVEPTGWAVLHGLRETIEGVYSGWFIPQLSTAWSTVLEGPQGLLSNWKLPEVVSQQAFYERRVLPLFDGGVKRVFVLISDAFRYEVAQELVQHTNSKSRFKASLEGMLGVLPSYTALGMAALLPHQTLAYKESANLDVLVDGHLVATLEQRCEQLQRFGGLAIKAEDLMALGKDKGRELVRDQKLVYIYHDRIDMIGDKQASETKTFEAAAQTVQELANVLGFVINSLNGSTVLVTADHGFMYQESALDDADKSTLEEKPAGTLKAKKRYLIGRDLGATAKAWSGNTAVTAGTTPEGSLDFWLPKGASRFHFAGGARFVHGSAMPQEVVVPVITVRVSEAENAKTKYVSVSLLGTVNKVVTNTQRFEFIQTDAVSERVLARSVVVSLRDFSDDGKPISNEQSITFDSTSQLLDERKRTIFLTVQAGTHDPHKRYDLVMRDAVSKVEVLRLPIKVDLAFGNDF